MSAPSDRSARLELVLVVSALLLPIPLLAASGLGIPLPAVVERGIASLVPPPSAGVAESTQTTPLPGGSRAGTSTGSGSANGAGSDTRNESGEFPSGTSRTGGTFAGTSPPKGENTPRTEIDDTSPSPDGGTPPGGTPAPDGDQPTALRDSPAPISDGEPDVRVKAEAPRVSAGISVDDGGVDIDPIGDGSDDGAVSAGVSSGDDAELHVTLLEPLSASP